MSLIKYEARHGKILCVLELLFLRPKGILTLILNPYSMREEKSNARRPTYYDQHNVRRCRKISFGCTL